MSSMSFIITRSRLGWNFKRLGLH